MKRDKWDKTAWTPFEEASVAHYPVNVRPHKSFINSIYQVSIWYDKHELFGNYAHLSFKTHDRSPRHDWREMQRIKNELCGPEYWAIEFYPPESKVVDTANQYHLYCFENFQFTNIGFQERLVSEGSGMGAVQRPFRAEFRPNDLTPSSKLDKDMQQVMTPPIIKSK